MVQKYGLTYVIVVSKQQGKLMGQTYRLPYRYTWYMDSRPIGSTTHYPSARSFTFSLTISEDLLQIYY